jgi:hypothetical protein
MMALYHAAPPRLMMDDDDVVGFCFGRRRFSKSI